MATLTISPHRIHSMAGPLRRLAGHLAGHLGGLPALALVLAMAGCGGGSGSAPPVQPTGTGPAIGPAISVAPASIRVPEGDSAIFTVAATGSDPLEYQWQRDGTAIAGARSAALTLDGVGLADDGARFSVVVGNAAGSITSPAATLNVTARPGLSVLAGKAGGPGNVDGKGASAAFLLPVGVARDAAGNVYVADTGNNLIRRIAPDGTVTTVAGTPPAHWMDNTSGYVDGPSSSARFNAPQGIAADSAGNLFVADSGNHAIRKITPDGVVSTFAGSTSGSAHADDGIGDAAGFSYPTALAIDGSDNLYVADTWNSTVRRITPAALVSTVAGSAGSYGNLDGPVDVARFSTPTGIAVDADGNVFVADQGNQTVRRITPGGLVSTVAGSPGEGGSADGIGSEARFQGPAGLASDSAGNLYVTDMFNNTIRKITPAGEVTTLAGQATANGVEDGSGAQARFYYPSGIASDTHGNLVVADRQNARIRQISPAGTVTTLAGSSATLASIDGTGSAASFAMPYAIASDGAGSLIVADYLQHVIRRISPQGVVTTIAGSAGSAGSVDGPAGDARFFNPFGVAVDAAGNIYVADMGGCTVRRIAPDGMVSTIAGAAGENGTNDGIGTAARFTSPVGLAAAANGDLYVVDGMTTVRRITPDGAVTTIAGTAGIRGSDDGVGSAASFGEIYFPTIGPDGNLTIPDMGNATVRRVTPEGVVSTIAGRPGETGSSDGPLATATFLAPAAAAYDRDGHLYLTDFMAGTVRRIAPDGMVSTVAGRADGRTGIQFGALPGRLTTPIGIAATADGTLYLTMTSAIVKLVLP